MPPVGSRPSWCCLLPMSLQPVPPKPLSPGPSVTHLLEHHKLVLSSGAPVDFFFVPVEGDKTSLLDCSSVNPWNPPSLHGNLGPIATELHSKGKTVWEPPSCLSSPVLVLISSLVCHCTYLVLYSSTYCRMFCSSDSSCPLCPRRVSNLLLRFWM